MADVGNDIVDDERRSAVAANHESRLGRAGPFDNDEVDVLVGQDVWVESTATASFTAFSAPGGQRIFSFG